ncbi:hypothetical protein EVAR_17123_1 [Eumeta japonica]|uniref:Uncharacterized protein n=1 Tax=Eumeta variegata TaxID=151549 RepID=A0A4C1ULV4_EUMVA|nr:hypothetical protein EVAR_17123_1 [Eumeta japonica]
MLIRSYSPEGNSTSSHFPICIRRVTGKHIFAFLHILLGVRGVYAGTAASGPSRGNVLAAFPEFEAGVGRCVHCRFSQLDLGTKKVKCPFSPLSVWD